MKQDIIKKTRAHQKSSKGIMSSLTTPLYGPHSRSSRNAAYLRIKVDKDGTWKSSIGGEVENP